ncbi:MAG: enolase C-terminal domain-like protein [Acidimicrobiales bacterium]
MAAVRLEGVELVRVDLALRRPVVTSAGAHRARPVIYARVVTDRAEGWGECGALAEGTAVDPPLDALWVSLAGDGVRRLVRAARARGGALPPAPAVARLFNADALGRLTAATLEMAVLDAELRDDGAPLAKRLGSRRAEVAVGAIVGIPDGRRLGPLLDEVDAAVSAGAARVRLKIEPGWDFWPVRSVRERHPDLALQVDANGAYRLTTDAEDDARRLAALDPFGLTCVEQPLAAGDLPALAQLATLLATPVALDESLTSLRRLDDALRYGACEVACLKPARLGGLFAARRAQASCAAAGVPAFMGGLFETGLGRSANAALASLPGFTLPGDLSSPAEYLVEEPCGYPTVREGRLSLSGAPGVGPAPDPSALDRLAVERAWFPCPA